MVGKTNVMDMFSMKVDLCCIPSSTKTGVTSFLFCYMFDCIDFISSCIEPFDKSVGQLPLSHH